MIDGKNVATFTFSIMSKVMPLAMLRKLFGIDVLFPYYHTVSNAYLPYINHLYKVKSVDEFVADLRFLKKHFRPVSLAEAMEMRNNKNRKKESVFHLSFDDGLKECYSIIAPILQEYNIPATFFLCSDFIDNRRLFYRFKVSLILEKLKSNNGLSSEVCRMLGVHSHAFRAVKKTMLHLNYQDSEIINRIFQILHLEEKDFLEMYRPFLTSEEVDELIGQGFTIGSHSVDHPLFSSLSDVSQKSQIEQSMQYLKNKFEISHPSFSFPFTADGVSDELFTWMSNQGYHNIFGTLSQEKDKSKYIHRLPLEMPSLTVSDCVKLAYVWQ